MTAVTPSDRLEIAASAVSAAHDAQRQAIRALVELWPDAAWRASGAHSPVGWLQTATGCSVHEARRLVRLAELCAAHPVLDEAVASGAMPLGRAESLGRFATSERAAFVVRSIDTLVALGRDARTDDEFLAGVRFWAEQVDQELAPASPGRHRVVLSESLFGGGHVDADLHPAAFATVAAAFDAWTQDPDPATAPHRRTLAERRADAFDDIAHFALTHGCDTGDDEPCPDVSDQVFPDTIPDDLDTLLTTGEDDPLVRARQRIRTSMTQPVRRERRRTRPKAGVHATVVIDLHTLAERNLLDLEGVQCRSERWTLTKNAADQMLCDANLSAALFARSGQPLDATHASPRFSPRQRAVIAARDRGCVFPTCHRPSRHCDVHHPHPVELDGPSTVDNAATLCRHHHRLVHHGWTLRRDEPNRWTVTDPDGQTWTDGLPVHAATTDERRLTHNRANA